MSIVSINNQNLSHLNAQLGKILERYPDVKDITDNILSVSNSCFSRTEKVASEMGINPKRPATALAMEKKLEKQKAETDKAQAEADRLTKELEIMEGLVRSRNNNLSNLELETENENYVKSEELYGGIMDENERIKAERLDLRSQLDGYETRNDGAVADAKLALEVTVNALNKSQRKIKDFERATKQSFDDFLAGILGTLDEKAMQDEDDGAYDFEDEKIEDLVDGNDYGAAQKRKQRGV